MRIEVLTLFPEELSQSLSYGVVGRARDRGILKLGFENPRDHTLDPYRRIDDRVFGGGPGMVFLLDPLKKALDATKTRAPSAPVIYLSPQGPRLTQKRVRELIKLPELILLCGRYEGLDERFVESYVDAEVSVGDFVLSGGEPAAVILIDAMTRLLPGAINSAESALQDSFEDGLLDCPHFTRPESSAEGEVPAVLRSGNHKDIANWRRQQSLGRTWLRRPDLLAAKELTSTDRKLLADYIAKFEKT